MTDFSHVAMRKPSRHWLEKEALAYCGKKKHIRSDFKCINESLGTLNIQKAEVGYREEPE